MNQKSEQLELLKPPSQEMKFYLVTVVGTAEARGWMQNLFQTYIYEIPTEHAGLNGDDFDQMASGGLQMLQKKYPSFNFTSVSVLNFTFVGRKTYEAMYPSNYNKPEA